MLFIGKIFKYLFLFIISILIFISAFFYFVNSYIEKSSNDRIFQDSEQLPEIETGLILGASVNPDKEMSEVFKDRVEKTIEIYNKGKIKKILISGDGRDKYYDEVAAAERYLLEAGIPQDSIILDKEGFNTYTSIYRAKNIYKIDSLTIITQNFHLPRAVYIAKNLGIDSYGVSADLHDYEIEEKMFYREKAANIKAFFDINAKRLDEEYFKLLAD